MKGSKSASMGQNSRHCLHQIWQGSILHFRTLTHNFDALSLANDGYFSLSTNLFKDFVRQNRILFLSQLYIIFFDYWIQTQGSCLQYFVHQIDLGHNFETFSLTNLDYSQIAICGHSQNSEQLFLDLSQRHDVFVTAPLRFTQRVRVPLKI